MRPRDRLRLEAGVGCKFDEQPFIGDQIVEHRAQERRVRSRGSEVIGAQSGYAEEPVSRSGSAAMKVSALTARDRAELGLADCIFFKESRIVRFAFRQCLALILPGAPAEFTLHGTPDAQDRAHC